MRMKIMCINLVFLVSLIFVSSISSPALAGEAGLVTYVSDNVYFSAGTEEKKKAVSFMKAKTGDIFYLEESAKLHLVYFESGRKEKWEGSVEISVSKGESIVVSSVKKSPSVSTTDNMVEGLRAIPAIIENINTERTGSVTMRAFPYKVYDDLTDEEKKEVSEINSTYKAMLEKVESDDITPELFTIGRLASLKLYKETLGAIIAALKKQPENDGLTKLRENLEFILKKYKKD